MGYRRPEWCWCLGQEVVRWAKVEGPLATAEARALTQNGERIGYEGFASSYWYRELW